MKNLKKVLSLVLALAMALSLMTAAFAADASDYKDYSKVTYKEAVDVMTAAGIFNGGDGNNFNPDATLNREQAAKIITYMLVGQEKADKLTATVAPYADVAANRWSAGAIAYCTNEGILAGDGNGRFNPTAPVLGTQFAKMLLVALGYDAKIENLVGNSWAINTAKLALGDADLDNGMEEISLSDNLTREQAAQMAYNAMKATLVEYEDKGGDIIIGDIPINIGASKATPVTSTNADKQTISKDKATDSNAYTVQFAEKYCEDLVAKEGTDDAFGHPATEWKYDGSKIGTYADDADNSVVMDKTKSLKDSLTSSDYMNYDNDDVLDSAKVYFNGYELGEYKNLKSDDTYTGAGDIVEAYENDDDEVDTIVISRYVAAQIDDVDEDLSSTYTKKGASVSVTLTKVDSATIPAGPYYDDYNSESYIMKGYTSDYTEDTVLAVAFKYDGSNWVNQVLNSYVAEKITSGVSAYTKDYIKADGTKYTYAAQVDGADADSTYNSDDEYDIYVSKDGYAIAVTGAGLANLNDVYYVTGVYGASSNYGGVSYYAQAVNVMTGEVEELQLENPKSAVLDDEAFVNLSDSDFDPTIAGLYVMTDKKASKSNVECKANNDKFNAVPFYGNKDYNVTIAKATAQNDGGYALVDDIDADASSIKVQNAKTYTGTSSAASKATTKLYLNDKTSFVAAEDVKGDIAVKTATGSMKMSEKDPGYVAVIFKNDGNKAAYMVYAGADLGSAVSSEDVVYLVGDQDFDINTKEDTTNAKLWFMDGMTEKDVVVDGTLDSNDQGFYTYDVNSDDEYTLEDNADSITANVDDDTDGVASITVYSDEYNGDNHLLSDGSHFDDVSYADAKIIDARTDDAKDASAYSGTISSVGALESALDKVDASTASSAKGIKLDVYVKDGDILFIAVTEVEKEANQAPDGGNDTDAQFDELTVATSGTTTTITATMTDNVDKDVTLSVKVQKESASGWLDYGTCKVTVNKDSKTGTGTVENLPAGNYQAIYGDATVNFTIK